MNDLERDLATVKAVLYGRATAASWAALGRIVAALEGASPYAMTNDELARAIDCAFSAINRTCERQDERRKPLVAHFEMLLELQKRRAERDNG